MTAYLDAIQRAGTPLQARDAAAAQRTWWQSLSRIYAPEVAIGGAAWAGRLPRETSAQALAGQLSDLPNWCPNLSRALI